VPKEFPGRDFGKFHSFVYDGPGFWSRIEVSAGEIVERDGC
jgi:diphthamide synthase (EF-2-diphthine--ammonia ligase)